MRNDPMATARASSDPHESANSTGRRVLLRATLVVCAIGVFVSGGCSPSRLATIGDEATFNEQVLKADRPVVVEFSKGGCVWCLFLASRMDPLVGEYRDRARFAQFELVDVWGKIASETLWKRYRIGLFPTVVLFVGGREKKRWVVDYNPDNYRKGLNEIVGPPTPKTPPRR
jgi:thiol-disulfide isomerase/thioredoxin